MKCAKHKKVAFETFVSGEDVSFGLVLEIGDKLRERKCEDDNTADETGCESCDEESVVVATDAVVEPATVMVEIADALVAVRTVLVCVAVSRKDTNVLLWLSRTSNDLKLYSALHRNVADVTEAILKDMSMDFTIELGNTEVSLK